MRPATRPAGCLRAGSVGHETAVVAKGSNCLPQPINDIIVWVKSGCEPKVRFSTQRNESSGAGAADRASIASGSRTLCQVASAVMVVEARGFQAMPLAKEFL